MANKLDNKMPPAQALIWVIEGAIDSIKWLRQLETEWIETVQSNLDGSAIRKKQRIVGDAFTGYITSLFDETSRTHSLVRSYLPNQFIDQFKNHDLVKRCIMHRNNRFGHQSEKYGFVVPQSDIIASNLDDWLQDALILIATGTMTQVPQ